MKLAFWPGGGGDTHVLDTVPLRGVEAQVVDPRYDERIDWRIESLAADVVASGAEVYGGFSWGGAVAATAAAIAPPTALVLVDGGHFGGPDFGRFDSLNADERIAQVLASVEESDGYPRGATLEAILRAYEDYDAAATLARLSRDTAVLLLVSGRNEASVQLAERFADLVPWGERHVLDTGHDVLDEAPDEAGELITGWLGTRVAG